MIGIRYLSKAGVLLGLLLLSITPGKAAIQVELDGNLLQFDVPPTQVNGRTMVPLRGIFESLGAQVDWESSSRTINASKDGSDVQLSIGNRHATVNGRDVLLDTPAMILRGSTMVPLRFVSEALGADVKWLQADQTVSITSGSGSGTAIGIDPYYSQNYSHISDRGITDREIRNLVAPIALYPDPLLAIILPASTYVDQVIEADRMNIVRNEGALDRQDWDISVRALAHYPNVLRKMANDPDWTASLGQAYVQQPQDVMDAIQRLREQARYNGVLRSTREQRVYLDGEYIRIVPAQTNRIYVPQYNPDVVYVRPRSNTNHTLLAFGAGLLIGSWLNNDTDWSHRRIYNHNWRGTGWVATARPHVTINNTYTVNRDQQGARPIFNRDRTVIVNREVINRQVDRKKVRSYKLPSTMNKLSQETKKQLDRQDRQRRKGLKK